MKKQTERIREYIEEFGSINPLQALSDLGVMRLAARISDLREEGVPIEATLVTGKNRYGETVRYSEYTIKGVEVCSTPSYLAVD